GVPASVVQIATLAATIDPKPRKHGGSMLGSHRLVAFIATRDARRARDFYEKILGLRVISDDDYAIAIDANGTMLRIQKVAEFAPHSFTALGWEIPDI